MLARFFSNGMTKDGNVFDKREMVTSIKQTGSQNQTFFNRKLLKGGVMGSWTIPGGSSLLSINVNCTFLICFVIVNAMSFEFLF